MAQVLLCSLSPLSLWYYLSLLSSFLLLSCIFLLPTSYVLLLLCLKHFSSRFFPIGLILQFQSLLKVRPSLTLLFNILHSPLPKIPISLHTFHFPQMSFTTYNTQYLLICFVYCGSPSTHENISSWRHRYLSISCTTVLHILPSLPSGSRASVKATKD